ncbi:MAG: DNA gyrase C-terminal beta-propeller domain-containing protein, partial [Candidatus Hodarchaeota archaeon]
EFKTLSDKIAWIQEVLADDKKVYNLIKEELQALKEEFGDERRTEIIPESHVTFDLLEEKSPRDYIPETQIIIARTLKGYISSMPLDLYKQQHRGGKGIYALDVREGDMVIDLITASNFDTVLFFTESGKVYGIPGYVIPQHKRASRGIALVQVLEGLEHDGTVTSVIPVSEFRDDCFLFQITESGKVKKTPLMEFSRIMKSGKRSIALTEGDKLRCALITEGDAQLLLATEHGKAIRFSEKDVRSTGRASQGVRGIRLEPEDRVVDAVLVQDDMTLLTVTEKGYGKRTPFSKYRLQRRGGKGLINIRITEKNGHVVAILRVDHDAEIMAISATGKIIRTLTKSIRPIGRITQGVRVMRLNEDDQVVGVAKVLTELERPENDD